MTIRLDVGAGTHTTEEDWITLDLNTVFRPTFQGDMLAMPVKDESVDRIRCEHVLEHLPPTYTRVDWDARIMETRVSFIDAMNEMWRVLKDKGQVEIEVPVFPYPASLADPTHLSLIVAERFLYLDPEQTLMSLCGVSASTRPYLAMYAVKPWKLIHRERKATGSIFRVVMEKRPC